MQNMRGLAHAIPGFVVLWGCTGEPMNKGTTASLGDSTASGIPTIAMVDSVPGELALRKEPVQFFQRAHTAIAQKDARKAAAALRDAARYFRQVRDSAAVKVKARLTNVEGELDSLARVAEGKEGIALRALDGAFARANLAEAERHAARLDAAWVRKDTMSAAAEIIMTVDHIERANTDAAAPADKYESLQLAAARRLGTDLLKHVPLTSGASMARVQQDLRSVIAATEKHTRKTGPARGS